MKVDKTLISKLERLSLIKLNEDEREEMISELEKMIDMIDHLAKAKTNNSDIDKTKMKLREDTVKEELDFEKIKHLSKETLGRYYTVPKVIKSKK